MKKIEVERKLGQENRASCHLHGLTDLVEGVYINNIENLGISDNFSSLRDEKKLAVQFSIAGIKGARKKGKSRRNGRGEPQE